MGRRGAGTKGNQMEPKGTNANQTSQDNDKDKDNDNDKNNDNDISLYPAGAGP